jgi:hypothetical protein
MELSRWLRANLDRAGAWLAIVVGAIALIVGWHGAAHTAYPAEQIPYLISGGIGGALLVAFGATLLISADLRDEWHKLDRIERKLDAPPPPKDGPSGGEVSDNGNVPRSRPLTPRRRATLAGRDPGDD